MGRKKSKQGPPQHYSQVPAIELKPKTRAQTLQIKSMRDNDITFAIGSPGTGKAQPIDELVCTPTGYVQMGSLSLGDTVMTPDGSKSTITAIFPQGVKDIYRIIFDNEDSVECCLEHLWKVHGRDGKSKVVNTEYLLTNLKTSGGRRKWYIETTASLDFEPGDLPIDPYLLGLLLGDGSFTQTGCQFWTADVELVEAFKLQYPVTKLQSKYGYQICDIVSSLKTLDLMGKNCYNKKVPNQYKWGLAKNRLALIQGLMDSDGYAGGHSAEFVTVSKDLAEDFKHLIETIGGKCTISECRKAYSYKGETKIGALTYRCTPMLSDMQSLFRIERKKKRMINKAKYPARRWIDRIEFSRQAEAKCIKIDHPDSLYLTRHCIVTHNTHCAVTYGLKQLMEGRVDRLILVRPVIEAGEKLGFLPGDIEQKLDPYLQPCYDVIAKHLGPRAKSQFLGEGKLQIAPLAFMRGRTFDNACVILDEAQNADEKKLEMFLTRLGENSTFIICGDPSQYDIENGYGIVAVANMMKDLPGVGVCLYDASDVVRHPLVEAITRKFAELRDAKNRKVHANSRTVSSGNLLGGWKYQEGKFFEEEAALAHT